MSLLRFSVRGNLGVNWIDVFNLISVYDTSHPSHQGTDTSELVYQHQQNLDGHFLILRHSHLPSVNTYKTLLSLNFQLHADLSNHVPIHKQTYALCAFFLHTNTKLV